jgi:hypothetical protein
MSHKNRKHPQQIDVVASKSSPAKILMIHSVPSQDKIRERAYELYEDRGRKPGQSEQDWLRAEHEFVERAG